MAALGATMRRRGLDRAVALNRATEVARQSPTVILIPP